MKTVFTNGRIILADRILDGYSVIVEDGVISDVTRGNTAADKVVDLGGRYLAPGFIDTDMTAGIDKDHHQLAGMIPLKRMGRPEDVANLAVFLAGSGSDYITGEVIRVDGGLAM